MSEGQQPGENDRDYIRRISAEGRRQDQVRRDQARQDRLDLDAAREREDRAEALDNMGLDAFFTENIGASLGEIQKAYNKGKFDHDATVRKAVEAVTGAKGDRRRRKATIKHKKALKKGAKAAKSGCAVMAVLMLAGATFASWGGYEAISALIS